MSDADRPAGPMPPRRRNHWHFGDRLFSGHDFMGYVDAIYVDYWAARNSNVISEGWFELQETPPSTKDQIFYSLVAEDGSETALVGQRDARSI